MITPGRCREVREVVDEIAALLADLQRQLDERRDLSHETLDSLSVTMREATCDVVGIGRRDPK